MKKVNFLDKLKKEKKLEIVEPSEEIKQSYIEKSENSIASAKILLENNLLEDSVALAYYGMYHVLIALLFRVGIKSENHSASIILLKKIFDIDNSEILFAKKERVDKQYYIDFRITREQVGDAIRKAEVFTDRLIDFISRLSNESIGIYREKFKEMLSD